MARELIVALERLWLRESFLLSNMSKTAPVDEQDFAVLVDQDLSRIPQVGDTVTGTVLTASKAEVRLDINGIMTGVVRGRELFYEAIEYADLKPGDEIEATVMEGENENGELELSFRFAGQEKTWTSLTDSFTNGTPLKVKIIEANRGGLLVSYMQTQAFLPVSQLSPEHYPRVSGGDKNKILEKLKSIVGKEIEVKVITLDKDDQKLIVSEKAAWQERQHDVLTKYAVGTTVEGAITAVTNFGVFVSFGESLEGLIHISELAWQRIDDPSELYKVGDAIKAEIINVEGAKIFLSAKKLVSDPWNDIKERYQIGSSYKGTIIKVNPFGLFVELDKNIHGLAHVSQLSLASGQKLENLYKVGEEREFVVVSIEPDEHRLGLSVDKLPVKEQASKETEVIAVAGAESEVKDEVKE